MILHRRTPMTVVRWNAARELASMEIDRLNQMFANFYANGGAWAPAVDISEMKREDIHLSFENHVLTLSGERPSEPVEILHRSERFRGQFSRSFNLPNT